MLTATPASAGECPPGATCESIPVFNTGLGRESWRCQVQLPAGAFLPGVNGSCHARVQSASTLTITLQSMTNLFPQTPIAGVVELRREGAVVSSATFCATTEVALDPEIDEVGVYMANRLDVGLEFCFPNIVGGSVDERARTVFALWHS